MRAFGQPLVLAKAGAPPPQARSAQQPRSGSENLVAETQPLLALAPVDGVDAPDVDLEVAVGMASQQLDILVLLLRRQGRTSGYLQHQLVDRSLADTVFVEGRDVHE